MWCKNYILQAYTVFENLNHEHPPPPRFDSTLLVFYPKVSVFHFIYYVLYAFPIHSEWVRSRSVVRNKTCRFHTSCIFPLRPRSEKWVRGRWVEAVDGDESERSATRVCTVWVAGDWSNHFKTSRVTGATGSNMSRWISSLQTPTLIVTSSLRGGYACSCLRSPQTKADSMSSRRGC
jgi:hypothetical protein